MARSNLCQNPALDVDVTGWGGGSTPTRVTVSGFPKGFAARFTSGTFLETATGNVTVGNTYTLSLYIKPPTPAVTYSGTLYIGWLNSGGGYISFDTTAISIPGNTVTRVNISGTAPTGAVACRAITDGWNFGSNTTDFSALLIEPGGSLNSYADGDTAGWAWDGTTGLSSSAESTPTIAPSGIASSATFGTAALAGGTVTVAPSSIDSAETFGALFIDDGQQRHNLCPNPALDVDTSGWSGNGSTSPARVTVSGFLRSNGAEYTDGTDMYGPIGAVTAGLSYTWSLYVKPTTSSINIDRYIEWRRVDHSVISYTSAGTLACSAGVVSRIDISGTAPVDAIECRFIGASVAYSVNTCQYTAALLEAGPLNSYADGNSTDWHWDGTSGASTSSHDVPEQSVFPSAVATGAVFGSASVSAAPVNLSPAGIASIEAFGSDVVSVGPVTLAPIGFDASDVYVDVYGDGYGQMGAPTVGLGALPIGPTGIATATAFGNATVAIGPITISPTSIASGNAFGATSVSAGPVSVAPVGIASGQAVSNPVVTVPGGPLAIIVPSVAPSEVFGAARIVIGTITWRLILPKIIEKFPIRGSLVSSISREVTVFGDEAGLFTSDQGNIPIGGDDYGAIPFGTKYIWHGGHVNTTTDSNVMELWLSHGFEVEVV